MQYPEFEKVMSPARMNRYVTASVNNTKKAMTLYRYNSKVSQEMFTVIGCFEIALRNATDNHYLGFLGDHWLKNSVLPGGAFEVGHGFTRRIIVDALRELDVNYSHSKLIAKMDFGFWRYLFAPHQFRALGQTLLKIFPSKPASTRTCQCNHSFFFNELAKVNKIRNRIAHHEPICFQPRHSIIDTSYVREHYHLLFKLFEWMAIDEAALLYGLDHIVPVCDKIDALKIPKTW